MPPDPLYDKRTRTLTDECGCAYLYGLNWSGRRKIPRWQPRRARSPASSGGGMPIAESCVLGDTSQLHQSEGETRRQRISPSPRSTPSSGCHSARHLRHGHSPSHPEIQSWPQSRHILSRPHSSSHSRKRPSSVIAASASERLAIFNSELSIAISTEVRRARNRAVWFRPVTPPASAPARISRSPRDPQPQLRQTTNRETDGHQFLGNNQSINSRIPHHVANR